MAPAGWSPIYHRPISVPILINICVYTYMYILYHIITYCIILYYIILYLPLLVGSRPQLLPGVSSIPIFVCAVACPPSAAFSRCSRLSHSGQAAHCAAARVAQGAMPTLGEATRSSSRVPGIARSNLWRAEMMMMMITIIITVLLLYYWMQMLLPS